MENIVLTLNAGSSSVKFSAFTPGDGGLEPVASGQVEGLGATPTFSVRPRSGEKLERRMSARDERADHHLAVGAILGWLAEARLDQSVLAVGHRVVHGGIDFVAPVAIDDDVLAKLKSLVPLAPLHQPHNIVGIEAARQHFPKASQVACFDTAFHRSHPLIADTFALPRRFYEEGIRRYGFHGLSYEYIARRLRAVAPRLAAGRVIVAHLGNGASLCAMRDGKSMASTMSFTALDGLPMGTRPGQIDPGVVLYLIEQKGMSATQVQDLFYHECGLKGLSAISNDVRELEASADARAHFALDYFCYRVGLYAGMLAAALQGIDAFVFTAGIGENSAGMRARICANLTWLGATLDPAANAVHATRISRLESRIGLYVIPTDEELMIARHTQALLSAHAKQRSATEAARG